MFTRVVCEGRLAAMLSSPYRALQVGCVSSLSYSPSARC
jgi:hypothetical protein